MAERDDEERERQELEEHFGDPRSRADFAELSRQIALKMARLLVRETDVRGLPRTVVAGALLGAAVRVAAAELNNPALVDWLRTIPDAYERGDQAPVRGPWRPRVASQSASERWRRTARHNTQEPGAPRALAAGCGRSGVAIDGTRAEFLDQ